ncbi:DEAD/DEAH box helicase [Chitinibacter sp. ZOR0017]|uniref:DEAD/DEAH box helicase n=1 Tax=Chitinibacter sp. ZOR0017 TaxID=1339254 RepID=UPI000A66E91E|nr:DEAD/DEAH box helicase [Chitinibacter sp. ZOR0017]
MSDLTFAKLGLAEPLLRALADTGYTQPTPIQAQAIPQVLQGGDLLAAAQTGTGKTAGFTLPILQRLLSDSATSALAAPRVLILTPTRELAAQVEESVQAYGKYLPFKSMVMFGGVRVNPQIKRLQEAPVDILVATPGRLLDLAKQGELTLAEVDILVLDEADRMLDMGFINDIKKILKLLPAQRQNLLFSATFSDEIKKLADGLLNSPALVEVARPNTANALVTQRVHLVDRDKKQQLLTQLIKEGNWHQVLVFMRTKHACNRVAEKLQKEGITALAIHGNKSQNARTAALAQFKTGELQVLVATDIAARGLDIEELPHVVNLELPNVPEDYVHRIGRTGRAGCTGEALSLVCVDELEYLKNIEKLIKQPIEQFTVPGYEADLSVKPEPIVRGGLGRERPQRNQNSRPPKGWNKANAEALKAEQQAMLDAGMDPDEVAKIAAQKKAEAEREQQQRRRRPAAKPAAATGEGAPAAAGSEDEQQRKRNRRRGRGGAREGQGEARPAAVQARTGEQRPPRQGEGQRRDERRGERWDDRRDERRSQPKPQGGQGGQGGQRGGNRTNYDERQPVSNANALPFELTQGGRRGGGSQRRANPNSYDPLGGFPPIPRQGGYYDNEERQNRGGGRGQGGNGGGQGAGNGQRRGPRDANRSDHRKPKHHTPHGEGQQGQPARRSSRPTPALLGGSGTKPRDEE